MKNRQRFLSVFLAIVLVFGLGTPCSAFATESPASDQTSSVPSTDTVATGDDLSAQVGETTDDAATAAEPETELSPATESAAVDESEQTADVAEIKDPNRVIAASSYDDSGYIPDPDEGVLYAAGHILVIYDPDTSIDTANEIADEVVPSSDEPDDDAEVSEVISSDSNGTIAVVTTPESRSVAQTVQSLENQPGVIAACPDYILYPAETTDGEVVNDSSQNNVVIGSAALTNDDQVSKQYHLTGVGCKAAWSVAKSSHQVGVAVFDTGCNMQHPDLKNNIAPDSLNAVAARSDDYGNITNAPKCVGDGGSTGHGTHVAGIIGAESDNGIGTSGVAYNPWLVIVNVFDNGGAYTTDIVKAYTWLLTSGVADKYNVHAVNMSLGGPGTLRENQPLALKIDAANRAGIVTVAAAGNAMQTLAVPYNDYPADYSTCVSVINLQSNDLRSGSSNYGPEKDISAPGTGIYSTTSNGSYGYKSGTSMASPVVAGVVALEFAANPSLTADEAKQILYDTASDLGAPGRDNDFGYGKVNAAAAISSITGVGLPSSIDDSFMRLAGSNRYGTMSAISQAAFDRSDTAVLATGDNFPDALAAASLAGVESCPVLLTSSTSLGDDAKSELVRLGVKHVLLLGGDSAISPAVEKAVQRVGSGITTKRIAGGSRQETSLEIYRYLQSKNADYNTLIIASGTNFADTLAISPFSYAQSTPVLLAQNDGTLTSAQVAAIKNDSKIRNVVIVGGTSAVSDKVLSQIGRSANRLAGENRYATAAKIGSWELKQGMDVSGAVIATGTNFPDALAGSALCGSKNTIMVLASATDDQAINALLGGETVFGGFVLGGTGAVSENVVKYAYYA